MKRLYKTVPGAGVSLREMRAEDWKQVRGLLEKCFPGREWDRPNPLERQQEVWVATGTEPDLNETHVVGVACRSFWELRWVAVDSRWRRRGIAERLCQRVLVSIVDSGYDTAEVGMNPVTPEAEALYRKLGFTDENI